MRYLHKYVVECLGTALFIYVILKTGNYLAIGATLAFLIFLYSKISGGAFNPAVAFALFITKKINKQEFIGYTIAEILGAYIAFKAYKML
jgi:glycerol uptake facilitator-like aquaporin